MIEPRKLKGFRDYSPELAHARHQILTAVREEAQLAGFATISTPALEYSEVLLGQGGEETDKQVYRFEDHGGRDVALRYDLTVPFARYTAEHQGTLALPFKKFQTGIVWRGESPQKGRYREFLQADLDIVGADSAEADLEVLFCFCRVLERLHLGRVTVAVGNRPILSALIQKTLGDSVPESKALIALDKLDKIGEDGVCQIFSKLGVDAGPVKELLGLVGAKDSMNNTPIDPIRRVLPEHGPVIDRFETTLARLQDLSRTVAYQRDLSIARGLGYYTGIVFETTLDELPGFGSISSGGRYDNLVSRFTKREITGVGGSLGVDRLLAALEELGRLPPAPVSTVLVAAVTPDAKGYAFDLVRDLREKGISAEMGLQNKAAQQFKYAHRRGCVYVAAVGTEEMREQVVTLKEMSTGVEQKSVPRGKLADHLGNS